MNEPPHNLVPTLDPRPVTIEEYVAYAPVGLLETVRLAPEGRWREALERVYGR